MPSILTSCLQLSALFITGLCIGCSGPIKPRESGEREVPLTTGVLLDSAYASQYFVADTDCQIKRDSAILIGKGINVSFYNFYQRTTCGTRDGDCGVAEVVSDAQNLRICSKKSDYPRNSVEGVGRAAIGNLATALHFYETIPTASRTLSNAALLVLPRIETVYEDSNDITVSVDNLAYSPSYRGSPTFVIYPKGAKSVREGRWLNVNFWEVPWAIAHEFGHHVFNTHSGIVGSTRGIFNFLPLFGEPLQAQSGAVRKITNEELLIAVNEAFADLYAYYTLGGDPGVTDPLDCFQNTRDAGSSVFIDGTDKVMSAEVLATFTSNRAIAAPPSCKTPSFQEVHTIGAIIAYGIEQVYSAVVMTSGQANSKEQLKAKLLLAWAKRVGQTFPTLGRDNNSGRTNLGKLIQDAVKVAATNNRLPNNACQVVRRIFPTYAPGWLSGELSCR